MGIFDFLRPRPPAPVPRTWTHAKDVAVFAAPPTGALLERALAREGVQARVFVGPEGRAIEILTRFLPSVLLIRADEVDPEPVLAALAPVPGLAEVPVLLAGLGASPRELEAVLGARSGGVVSRPDPALLVEAAIAIAPELAD